MDAPKDGADAFWMRTPSLAELILDYVRELESPSMSKSAQARVAAAYVKMKLAAQKAVDA